MADWKTDARVQELAGLDPLEYDRVRRTVADELGVRVGTLDEEVQRVRGPQAEPTHPADDLFDTDEPWLDPVNGEDLLEVLEDAFRNYLAVDRSASTALPVWVLHAYAHDAAAVSPILAITSPEKRCGKTTALHILRQLVPRALPTSNITSASLFRAVERWNPTLLVDEADTFLKSSDELRGILNSGHDRASAYVIRTVGDDHEPRRFKTWAPKAIALIGSLHPTLEDRSVRISMHRRMPGEKIERLRMGDPDDDKMWRKLRRRCARWALDHLDALRAAEPKLPSGLHDRAGDNWRPLLAIAEAAGGDWPERARAAAIALTPIEDSSLATLILSDIRSVFDGPPSLDKIRSVELVEHLLTLEDRPWRECQGRARKALTTNGLSTRLRAFGIKPEKVRFGGTTAQAYRRESFEDSFSRYLPPPDPERRNNGGSPGTYEVSGLALQGGSVPA